MRKVFWWVPSVGYIGVRPTALLATFILFISCIWGGLSHGFKSFEAARIIGAWAVSCGEILPGIIVKDVFYLHERGAWMGLYMIFFQSLPAVGLIASGFVITGGGFRWYFWVFFSNEVTANGKFLTIVSAVILFGMIFFLPETQYARSSTSPDPSAQRSHLAERIDSTFSEKSQSSSIPVKKRYLQELKPWSGINPNGHKASFLFLFLRGWPLIVYPAVLYSTVVFGLAVSSILIAVGTAPNVFQAPPYNMTPGVQSCIYTAMLIGAFLGAIWGGYGTDLISKYRASKNDGVFEPESRLLLIVAPTLLVPSGLLMYTIPYLEMSLIT
jgi:Major Facilitator Superfamily